MIYDNYWSHVIIKLNSIQSPIDQLEFMEDELEDFTGKNTGFDAELIIRKFTVRIDRLNRQISLLNKLKNDSDKGGISRLHDAGFEIEKEITRTEKLRENLTKYNFYTFLKDNKNFNIDQIEAINSAVLENKLPFNIALISELGYIDYLKKEYCDFETSKRDKLLGEIFNAQPRRVRGNINVLNPQSEENRILYTAHTYIEKVQQFIKGLNVGL